MKCKSFRPVLNSRSKLYLQKYIYVLRPVFNSSPEDNNDDCGENKTGRNLPVFKNV